MGKNGTEKRKSSQRSACIRFVSETYSMGTKSSADKPRSCWSCSILASCTGIGGALTIPRDYLEEGKRPPHSHAFSLAKTMVFFTKGQLHPY